MTTENNHKGLRALIGNIQSDPTNIVDVDPATGELLDRSPSPNAATRAGEVALSEMPPIEPVEPSPEA